MAKEVKIVFLSAFHETVLPNGRTILHVDDAEKELAQLLNDGWEIVTAGGGFGASGAKQSADFGGFVILQR